MAASGEETALGQLRQEATCPICLDFFEQPMGLSCGHNFCRNCLAQLGTEFSCPQCRAKVKPDSAYPNRALANMVGLVKRRRLSEGAEEESSNHQLCREHRQPLQTFCSWEKSLLCPSCLGGHHGHHLLSLPKAAQEYKSLLDGLLEPLRKEGQKLLEQRQAEERSWQECQEKFAAEKQKVSLAVESLQGLLQERQPIWLAEQEEKMEAEWGVALAQLSGEVSRLQQLMAQTERKCRQSDVEFLQDIQDTVDRCRSYVVGRVASVSPRLQSRLQILLEKNAFVKRIVDSYKADLQKTLTRENLDRLLATGPAPQKPRYPKDDVTLNDSTAHPRLQCYRRSVAWVNGHQTCPDTPQRFDWELCVLGREEFTTGSHWWEVSVLEVLEGDEVTVMSRPFWAIGVAKESLRRKGGFKLCPQEGIWAVGKNYGREIKPFTKYEEKMSLQRPLRRLQVRLDYEVGKVEFLDAEMEVSLYTFQVASFYGEKLRPFFYVGHEGITLSM